MKLSSIPLPTTVALLFVVVAMSSLVDAADFEFIRASDTTACINFRGSPSDPWAYLSPSGINKRSAEAFCKIFLPSATTGVITTSDDNCYLSGQSGMNRYVPTIDCANKTAPLSNCSITGNTSPIVANYNYYGAGIKCLSNSNWDYYSSFTTTTSTTYFSTEGTYGTQTGRSISVLNTVSITDIQPDTYFTSGTLCIPPTPNEQVGTNLAKALCRTAGLPVSSNSTVGNGTSSSSSYQKYASNIQCSSSSTATLFNGGCTNTTHYYDEPATECSPFLPKLTCPVRFDIKLGDPIVSSGSDRGYQLVQLRPEGSDVYDGMMCIYSSNTYAANFANVMCHEMYGDDIDFAAGYSSYSSRLPTGTKEYLSSVRCTSSTYTKLSQCYGTITATSYQYPCSSYRGLVSCKLNQHNIVFSISTASATANPDKGYLMASVSAAGQTTPAAVCSDGFDQTAALAACRSVGYTPGPNASFTVATTTSTHAINNVTCPTSANKLTDCKLQYSGLGYKISDTARQVCSGRVYLDCDLGTPTVQFRTSSSYLQARLYSDAEWGWVNVGNGVTSEDGYYATCQHSSSGSGDSTISKSFLSISSCTSYATSYTDCTYEYTNGVHLTRDFHCSNSSLPRTASHIPGNSKDAASNDMQSASIVGISVGVALGVLLIVGVCICVVCKGRRGVSSAPESEPRGNANTHPVLTLPNVNQGTANVVEMSAASAYSDYPYSNSGEVVGGGGGEGQHHQQPVVGTPYPDDGGDAASFGGGRGAMMMGLPVSSDHDPCKPPPTTTPAPYGRGHYQ